MRLSGKVALVTGGSKGIGAGIAIRLAREGAAVAVNYRTSPKGADGVVAEIEQAGGRAVALHADVSKIEDIERLVSETARHFGRIDVLVNNAGLEKNAAFWDVAEEDFDQVLAVNLKGVFFTAQAVVRSWREGKQTGKIINISSVHEDLAFPHFAAYAASKGALKMLTRTLAVELGPLGITINNVAPGAIATPMNHDLMNDPKKLQPLLEKIPLGRVGQPGDVAGAVAFLASADGDYVHGETLTIDGGLLRHYREQ